MPTTELGKPCWDEENVEQVFKKIGVARTDEEGVDYFLASHAPVRNIRHDGTNEELKEETLFEALLGSKSEVQAVIHGDPGTGKSHLIHWLKLRTEDELRRGKIKKVVPILIERRTGSLKDALEQMIEQLGEDFKHYLSPVQEALSKISSDTAREKLVNNIGIELRPQQRADKKREPLPRLLKDLAEVCIGSKGFRDWLCRANGVSDAVIKHLTEKHLSETGDVTISEELPQFTPAELLPDVIYRNPKNNTQNVRDLIDEFDEGIEPELVEKAATIFNEVLPDAIKELTGLTGTSLRDIFDLIRTDLKKRGETLAVFIEDVSQMAVLDEDVFAAVEPQLRKGLCRMIAVVGSTEQVWNRIPDNQKDRVTHPISLGGNAIIDWQTDTHAVAEFTARYLNTVRLTREQISAVATYRRETGEDINLSACDNCLVREECQAKFGKTQVGKVEVGLFPFSKTAPKRLLNYLSKFELQKNARNLLKYVLLPTLDSGYEQLQTGNFPNAQKFTVKLPEIPFWGPFKQNFCGGWKDKDIYHLEFLAQGWFKADNDGDLAVMLEPLLAPLGFPEFSKRPSTTSKAIKIKEVEKPREVSKVIESAINTKLNKILQDLKSWMGGDKLHEDVEVRKLLADLVRSSIVWDDITSPPREVWKNLIGGSEYAFVEIEDQFHSPQSTLVNFPRNEDTRNLIEALAQFKYDGTGSWDFEHGEYHKRIVAQWLRRYQQTQIIAQLQPPATIDTNMPIASAVQILATATLVRQRAKLSSDITELLKSILVDSWTEEPFALSKEWNALVKDMQLKHADVLRFVRNELNIPQGTGGIIFINSIPALNAALDFATAPDIRIPTEEYHQRYWKSRYAIFQNKTKYTGFLDALKTERTAISETVENIESLLKKLDYNTKNLSDILEAFCEDFIELLKVQVDAKEIEPFAPLNELGNAKYFASRKDVWQTAVKRAQIVITEGDAIQTLTFNPRTLKEAENAISIAFEYISRVDIRVTTRLQQFEEEGDPDLLETTILNSLENIEKMRT